MANNKFYRDFYSLPYDGRPTPDVFNSGILFDTYPGIQGALQNQIGGLDRYILISGFETTLASTTASINSGFAYIDGSLRSISAGTVTSVGNNDVIGLTKDGFKRMNAAIIGDYSKFTGLVFAVTNNDAVLREIHDGIQSSGLTEEYVGITKNTKNVAKKSEYFGEHIIDHSGAVGGALDGAFLFKDHGITLWRSMQGKFDFQVPIYFGGDGLTNSTNITYDAGFLKTNTGYSAPTGKFDIVDVGVGYIDICSGLTGQFGNVTGYYTASNTGQFGNVNGNVSNFITANITTANITTANITSLTEPDWILANFINGNGNGAIDFTPCRYRKIGSIVYIEGAASSNGQTIFTLPSNYRPSHLVVFPQNDWQYGTVAFMMIQADGDVRGTICPILSINCSFSVL
jgi:hypothetical protein